MKDIYTTDYGIKLLVDFENMIFKFSSWNHATGILKIIDNIVLYKQSGDFKFSRFSTQWHDGENGEKAILQAYKEWEFNKEMKRILEEK